MYVDPKSQIAGVTATRVRDFLRCASDSEFTCKYVSKGLKLLCSHSEELINELMQLGYLEPVDTSIGPQRYRRTLAGSSFAHASAARPLTRKTATERLAAFLERVRTLNDNNNYLYRVRKVLVFGSYLTKQDRLNDIDVAVELVNRENDPSKRKVAIRACIRKANEGGRQFSGIADEMYWPYNEVILFLKSKSRAISLHPVEDDILKQTESRVIFQDEKRD